MRIPAVLLSLSLASALNPSLTSARAAFPNAMQSSLSFQVSEFAPWALAFELPVAPQFALEADLGYHSSDFSQAENSQGYFVGAVGAKYFFAPTLNSWFVAGKVSGAQDPDFPNSPFQIVPSLTGGYRGVIGSWQWEAELGVGWITSNFTDAPLPGITPPSYTFPWPVGSLSFGYRF